MVEKTYHDIAPYLGGFGAYLMPQCPIYDSNGVFIYKNNSWNVAVNSRYLPSGQKTIEKTYHLAQYLGPFGAYLMPQ